MEINIIESSKNEIKVEIENLTIAEILRVYLNKDSAVTFVAWRRKHPTEKPVLLVQTAGKIAKKAINDAVNSIIKDLDKLESEFKRM
jgi:DNA-directed RNA polymerase subunit L